MSEEITEAMLENDNMEVMEDLIIEEIDDPIYTVDIKEEHDPIPDDTNFCSNIDDHPHIVCLGKEENTGEDVYHCALCNETFTEIVQHLNTNHHGPDGDLDQYDQNIQMIVEEKLLDGKVETSAKQDGEERTDFVCKHCNNIYETLEEAEYHECSGFNENRSHCSNCLTTFATNEEEEFHQCYSSMVKNEPLDPLFPCPECHEEFTSPDLLQEHQKSHKLKNQIKTRKNNSSAATEIGKRHCDICNTTFSSHKNLKLHAKMHLAIPKKSIKDAMPVGSDDSTKNQFYCEICNKSFDHALLTVHQNMHQNVEEHNCSICNRQFENQISYDMHMQLHADQPTRIRAQKAPKPGARFACNYCGREFLRPHEKVKHERIHTGEKPHECEVCGKCFRVSYSLTLHLRTHTDVRPFVCAQCNKRFKAYAVYSHHLNTHSEDRPFKCPMCPKSFRTSVQLCGHKNSHTKPYNCPECNRPFASLYAVKMHMKTHNKANKSNENLKHRCGICGAVYARMFALRFHMKEHHSADLTEEQDKELDNDKPSTVTADETFNEDEVSTQAIMQGEEIIIDNFHTEEIVTDWLTHK